MYQKILVPLDKSKEAEGVLEMVPEHLDPEGEVILLHVIPPGQIRTAGEIQILAEQMEQRERDQAMWYLRGLVNLVGEGSDRWHCEVVVGGSVADAIARYAAQEKVDLIMIYTQDRKGLAKLIKGSIAEKVWHRAPIKVQVIKPRELVAI